MKLLKEDKHGTETHMADHIVDKLTEVQRQKLIRVSRDAAIALAKYWDVVHNIGTEYGVEFGRTVKVLKSLATDTGIWPKPSDISASDVLTTFKQEVTY
jgi:hypothetical protein